MPTVPDGIFRIFSLPTFTEGKPYALDLSPLEIFPPLVATVPATLQDKNTQKVHVTGDAHVRVPFIADVYFGQWRVTTSEDQPEYVTISLADGNGWCSLRDSKIFAIPEKNPGEAILWSIRPTEAGFV